MLKCLAVPSFIIASRLVSVLNLMTKMEFLKNKTLCKHFFRIVKSSTDHMLWNIKGANEQCGITLSSVQIMAFKNLVAH